MPFDLQFTHTVFITFDYIKFSINNDYDDFITKLYILVLPDLFKNNFMSI